MRRWLTMTALGSAAMLALTGCANPGGVDGDLTNNWAALGEPKQAVPQAGTCHPLYEKFGSLTMYRPVECGQRHLAETTYIGSFTGEDASRTTRPPEGSPAMRAAWRECDTRTAEFLGGDWRTGRLTMTLIRPSVAGWSGGARWFRCDVSEAKSVDDDEPVYRTTSLKGALSGSSNLRLGCFAPKIRGEDIDAMQEVACSTRHDSEFVGVYTAPDGSYEAFIKDYDRMHRGCLPVIAAFVKVPVDGDLKYRSGTIVYPISEESWKAGDRGVRCFLWISKRNFTRSMKGAGNKGLPAT
ncbi:hypothetical protein GCM10027290_12420 [Micromonospora sonneratiae]|uniref:Septum formation family protein n=1 Tax=Micromonospora sonneratiae TaxID=1184706 RepID=A0ABW3YDX5_9ACTN